MRSAKRERRDFQTVASALIRPVWQAALGQTETSSIVVSSGAGCRSPCSSVSSCFGPRAARRGIHVELALARLGEQAAASSPLPRHDARFPPGAPSPWRRKIHRPRSPASISAISSLARIMLDIAFLEQVLFDLAFAGRVEDLFLDRRMDRSSRHICFASFSFRPSPWLSNSLNSFSTVRWSP